MKSAEFLGWALGGLEREIAHTRERLSELTAQAARLRQKVGAGRSSAGTAAGGEARAALTGLTGLTAKKGRKKRGRMSAAARKRMSERMTKRWAEWRKKNKKEA